MTDQVAEPPVDDSTEEQQTEARAAGWKPATEWKGDLTKWKPAKDFLAYAHDALPVLRKQNQEMHQSIGTLSSQIADLQRQVAAGKKVNEGLLAHHEEQLKKEVKAAKSELASQLKAAREAGDTELEVELLGEIQELGTTAAPPKKQEPTDDRQQPTFTPEYLAWVAKNPWFEHDPEKTQFAIALGTRIKKNSPTLSGSAFYAELTKAMNKEFGDDDGGDSKVNGSDGAGNGGNGGGGGKKGFATLPAEARKACHDDLRTFVGKGKMFDTQKAWEDHYATLYWSNEA